MYERHRMMPFFVSTITTVLVCALFGSFGLHAIQIAHDHPGHTGQHENGESPVLLLGEYMHQGEKKVFILPPADTLLFFAVAVILYGSWNRFIVGVAQRISLVLARSRIVCLQRRTYLEFLFARGIPNPKVYLFPTLK